jgi:hypothetical protein
MVYLGHFSFESHDSALPKRPANWRRYFSCMAEAESVDRALDKFDALLRKLARTSTVFSEVEEVYLDSCIEIKSIPRNGFMAYYKETRSECNESISTALVGVRPNHHLAAYEYTGDQSAYRVDVSVAQPFLVLRKSSDGFSV